MPSNQPQEKNKAPFVEVVVDQFNTYHLIAADRDDVEAPSDQEMRKQLKDFLESTLANRVLIEAHGEATHGKVLSAWDAAASNRVPHIDVQQNDCDQ